MIDINLTHKRALVCGASKGIGRAAAVELAELGCEIIALARDEKVLQELVAQLPTKNSQTHTFISADVSHLETLERQIKTLIKSKPIDILINNAGGPKPGPVTEATTEQFEQGFKTHVLANSLLAQCLLPGMKAQKYGRIINIVSSSVKSPIENLGVSNTIRWGVVAWAKTLSFEVAQFGITVNSILPGYIDTERLEALMQYLAKQRNVDVAVIRNEMVAQIPAGRLGTPEEIGRVIAFLATPAASYLNGIALPVDGGRLRTI